jgi:predicted ABC-type transport system involved in lysophospholipase L1 biosynthesis ATPase subunit
MIDTEKLAQIFVNNLNNKLTIELANGMIGKVLELLPKLEAVENVNTPATNPGATQQHNESESSS